MKSQHRSDHRIIGIAPCQLGLWLLLWCFNPELFAQTELDSSKAVRSINGQWWNHDSKSYNSPTAESFSDNPLRKEGRLGELPTQPSWNWKMNFSWLGEVLSYLFITFLALLLIVGLVLFIMHILRSNISSRGLAESSSSEIKIDPARVEDLPFEADQWMGDPLSHARKLAQQGRFDEAIIYLYGYQLLALDQSRKIHLHRGKTNRMYLREIELQVRLKELVGLTMDKFEQVYFGKHSLTKPSFLEVWSNLDSFHSLLSQSIVQNTDHQASTAVGGAL